MKPADQTFLFFLEDEGVLFHEPSQKLYRLNTTAAFIWCMLEEGKIQPAIIKGLTKTFKLTEKKARDFMEQTEKLFQSLGVIQGFESPEVIDEIDTKYIEPLDYTDKLFKTEKIYNLLSSRIKMRFSHMDQYNLIDPVLNHLTNNNTKDVTTTIDIMKDEETTQFVLLRDHTPILTCNQYDELTPMAKSLVWQTAVNAHDFFLDIHAGVVSDGNQCFLMPAAPGSGKSTLTAALVHKGFEYFSDEVALLHEGDLWVEAVPLATCVKDSGVDILSQFYPELKGLPLHLRSDGKRVRYISPPIKSLPAAGSRRPVGGIIFPRYDPKKQTTLKKINKMDAMMLLMKECLIVDTHLDSDKVNELLSWIERTPCYQLVTTDLNQAVNLLQDLSLKNSSY